MTKSSDNPLIFNSLSEFNRMFGMGEPLHPLITISDYSEASVADPDIVGKGIVMNFYDISYKKYFNGSIRYGQHHYDFAGGGLSFTAPMQLVSTGGDEDECEGLNLLIHPDFLRGYPLSEKIKKYGFFSYSANEALQLSDKEKEIILSLFTNIKDELSQRLDNLSQEIIISQLELLLNYSERFYHRQFLTRKAVNSDILTRMECLLNNYFNQDKGLENGLPTVQYIADTLNVTPGYLSDLLRSLTGLNAQQHIHEKLIEKAKEYLTVGNLSVAEIAYQLGFEHPQSFSKIFRKKTNLSPREYKQIQNHNASPSSSSFRLQ